MLYGRRHLAYGMNQILYNVSFSTTSAPSTTPHYSPSNTNDNNSNPALIQTILVKLLMIATHALTVCRVALWSGPSVTSTEEGGCLLLTGAAWVLNENLLKGSGKLSCAFGSKSELAVAQAKVSAQSGAARGKEFQLGKKRAALMDE